MENMNEVAIYHILRVNFTGDLVHRSSAKLLVKHIAEMWFCLALKNTTINYKLQKYFEQPE